MTLHPGITSDLREEFYSGSTFLIGGELYPRIVSPPCDEVSLLTHSLPSFAYWTCLEKKNVCVFYQGISVHPLSQDNDP